MTGSSIIVVLTILTVTTSAWKGVPVNVITILTDDQGISDNSYLCSNNSNMCAHTPHLDAMARSPHTANFHRFYAAAGVCSPTRSALLTGRTNERSCIHFALSCDQEDPAPGCTQGRNGALPWSEFTTADAAKKSKLGDYATIQIGKWHLGDLWNKHLPQQNPTWTPASPSTAGFDEWLTTEGSTVRGSFSTHHIISHRPVIQTGSYHKSQTSDTDRIIS
jgi:arylsulfatase A-like enzyme